MVDKAGVVEKSDTVRNDLVMKQAKQQMMDKLQLYEQRNNSTHASVLLRRIILKMRLKMPNDQNIFTSCYAKYYT